MLVNSDLREVGVPHAILKCGVTVSPDQLERAAKILREGDRCIVTSPRHLASNTELPGFIEPKRQGEDPEVLVFDVGIFTGKSYLIDRAGNVL